MAKENTITTGEQVKQPYKNMTARRVVLYIGLALTAAGFVLNLLGAFNLFLFQNMFKAPNPHDVMIYLFVAGLAADFVGIVFAVAGANTSKPLARLSFFLGLISFIIGAGILTVVLILTIIPNPAFERLLSGAIALLP